LINIKYICTKYLYFLSSAPLLSQGGSSVKTFRSLLSIPSSNFTQCEDKSNL